MTRQSHQLFLDINSDLSTTPVTTIDLSEDLHDRKIVGATLLHWNVEGLAEITDDYTGHPKSLNPAYPATSTEQYLYDDNYIQVKFSGSLESHSITYNARPDMIQLPCRSFNGWGISPHSMPVNFRVQPFSRRFDVSFWRSGSNPAPFVPATSSKGVLNTFRVLLWIELLTEPM
jgi:hypothetical protein